MKLQGIAIILMIFVADTSADKYDDMVTDMHTASPTANSSQAEPPADYCTAVHHTATAAMKARQLGVALPELMRQADKAGGSVALFKYILRAAYKLPRYYTEVNKEDAAQDFSNDLYARCLDDTLPAQKS